jgi:hypothetical protein
MKYYVDQNIAMIDGLQQANKTPRKDWVPSNFEGSERMRCVVDDVSLIMHV